MFYRLLCFALFLSSFVCGANFDQTGLFIAIRHNQPDEVRKLLKDERTNVNYQLKEDEHGIRFEPGMNALLYALSLERLTITEILLEEAKGLDVNLKNCFGINSVHMLAMVEVGDDRYDEDVDELVYKFRNRNLVYSPFRPVITPSKIEKVFDLLIEKGFSDFAYAERNLIAEALAHGKPYLAQRIAKAGGPMPDINKDGHSESIWGYLHQGSRDLDEQISRHEALVVFLKEYRAHDLLQRYAGPPYIKDTILLYSPKEGSPDFDKLIEFIKSILRNNKKLTANSFTDFLENAGSSLPENLKNVLRFKDI